MDTQIVAVFCLCDDLLKALHHREDSQCQMTDAEVMTTAIVAALHFRGNFELARHFLQDSGADRVVVMEKPGEAIRPAKKTLLFCPGCQSQLPWVTTWAKLSQDS